MSKKNKGDIPVVGWGYGYVVSDHIPNNIIGRVLTLIEVLGLADKQEKPFKDLITQSVWDAFNDGFVIAPETHTELRDRHTKMHNDARLAGVPPAAV